MAGLVAAGVYPNPVPHADAVTSTTHKTLRGPRGGIILARANEELEKKFNSAVFPGGKGGPKVKKGTGKRLTPAQKAKAKKDREKKLRQMKRDKKKKR